MLKDFVAVLAVVLLLFFVLLYVPLGVTAALNQNQALSLLAEREPLAIRIFWLLQKWLPRTLGILAACVVLQTLLRRLIPHSRTSRTWNDVPPLLTGGLFFLVAWLLITPRDAAFAVAVFLTLGVVVLLFGARGLVDLAGRHRWARRALVCVLAVLACLPLARLLADWWGARRLAAYEGPWAAEVAAERQRVAAVRAPVLRGMPLDENAAPRYRALAAGFSKFAETPGYRPLASNALAAGPDSPLDVETLRLLEKRREDVRQLREALRCNRCNWENDPTLLREAPVSLPALRFLGMLLVAEGHERAHAGDTAGAAERYLDAVRFGGDFGEGSLTQNMIGIALSRYGLEALGRLVVSNGVRRPPLEPIQNELMHLAPYLPTNTPGLRFERLRLGVVRRGLESDPETLGLRKPPIFDWLVPYHALAANAVYSSDALLRGDERIVTAESRTEANRISQSLVMPKPRWNPLSVVFRLDPELTRDATLDLKAWHALVQTAVALESRFAIARRYPADASELKLPRDPHAAPQLLRYEPSSDRTGYKLWSVGMNRKDDAGVSTQNLDLVLERRPVARSALFSPVAPPTQSTAAPRAAPAAGRPARPS